MKRTIVALASCYQALQVEAKPIQEENQVDFADVLFWGVIMISSIVLGAKLILKFFTKDKPFVIASTCAKDEKLDSSLINRDIANFSDKMCKTYGVIKTATDRDWET